MASCFPRGDFVFVDPPLYIQVMVGQKALLGCSTFFCSFVGVTDRWCFSTGDKRGCVLKVSSPFDSTELSNSILQRG